MLEKFYEKVLHRLRDNQIVYAQVITNGSTIRSMEDYCKICGKLRGLEEAEKVVKQIFKDFSDGKWNEIFNQNTIIAEELNYDS